LGNRKERVTAVFMLVVVTLFAIMWLADIVPALMDDSTPASVQDVGLPTNPVHVLDLAFFLPAVAFVGWALLQRHPLGYAAAPAMLVFLALTGLPILTTVFVADQYGHDAAWQLLAPIGVITLTSAILTWVMVHDLRLRR
jgi:FtsH-binding integral membrane protein